MTPSLPSRLLLAGLFALPSLEAAPDPAIAPPKSTDPRLEFTLVASEPQIVTPIGIAVDRRNRLFVVESHTHHRPTDYVGPESDLVKVFRDTNADGIPDTPKVFAEGFKSAMNLTLSPEDELYLVHRNGVVLLHDADGDDLCERRTNIVELETAQDYPHNGLSGIVFGRDGWLYLGIGENFSAPSTLRGSDGSSVFTGPGRGGKVYRCRADGSQLEAVAEGFWNPFGLEVDRTGRLFCVDNDPGGRPPCRLLHVVPGGDYGYRRRYSDTHPFNGWDGELPGTLPMLAGTGESPCGIFSADRMALPEGYAGSLLVASWGDAAIELYRLQDDGASFRATKENLVVGEKRFNEAFCPVHFAAAPDGSLYVTDWADRTSYPVHHKGRIWRLAAKAGTEVIPPAHAEPLQEKNAGLLRSQRLLAAEPPAPIAEVKAALADPDPFIRSAAIVALARPAFLEAASRFAGDADPDVRLAAMSSLRRAAIGDPVPLLRGALKDADDRVRLLALWWAGEDRITALADDLSSALAQDPTPALFDAYLAAAELLASEPFTPESKANPAARQQLIAGILHDDTQPASLLAMAASAVTAASDEKTAERLLHLAAQADPQVRQESVRSLAASTHPGVPAVLQGIALDTTLPPALRADAILSLARCDMTKLSVLTRLLQDPSIEVQIEAARALRLVAGEPEVRKALEESLASVDDSSSGPAEQLRFALQHAGPGRPTTSEAWHEALAQGGDAGLGRRVFQSVQTGCTACHAAEGRGTAIGPDLSKVARSFDRAKLVDAILEPSREVAPQYEHHIVTTKEDVVYSGVLIHIGLDASPLINALGTGRIRVPIAQVARHETSPLSMMPPGLEQTMTVADFRDLLAYLLTLH